MTYTPSKIEEERRKIAEGNWTRMDYGAALDEIEKAWSRHAEVHADNQRLSQAQSECIKERVNAQRKCEHAEINNEELKKMLATSSIKVAQLTERAEKAEHDAMSWRSKWDIMTHNRNAEQVRVSELLEALEAMWLTFAPQNNSTIEVQLGVHQQAYNAIAKAKGETK